MGKLGLYDHARRLVNEDKFEIRTKPAVKQSPGRRKDGEVNGVDADAMDTDVRDDIPDDLPRPMHAAENTPGIGFLFEWFSIFSDLFTAHQRSSKMQGGQSANMGPAAQYLMQHQNMQRIRESQQSQNLTRPNMMNGQFRQNGAMPQKPMQPGMANGMMNMGNAGSPMMQGMTPQQFNENIQLEIFNPRGGIGQQMQGTPGGGQSGNHALQDYQMQLMLLEQQNKKRLMMARQEQDNAVNRDGAPMVGMQP